MSGDPNSLAGVRILLAEDNPTNQMIALHMLKRLGCVSELVADGVAVLRRLNQASFDLVLMDIQMPRLDGLRATVEIRRREAEGWFPGCGGVRGDEGVGGGPVHLPVIAMTANALQGDRENCLAAQMDDYLTKPVSLEQLAEVLIRWVRRSRSWTRDAPGMVERVKAVPVLSWKRLEEVSQGDAEFEREFLNCLLSDLATSFGRLQTAPAPFDPDRAANLLHGIVGACRTVGANALGQVAREAEDETRRPGFTPGPEWLSRVVAARDRLVAAIAIHLGDVPR